MKCKYIFQILILCMFISNCCPKNPLPTIEVEYVGVNTSELEWQAFALDNTQFEYSTRKNSNSNFLVDVGSNEMYSDIVLILGDSIKIDTISNISVKRYGRCNNKIDINYQYKNVLKSNEILKIY